MIHLVRYNNRRPEGRVEIDWAHPLANGLRFCLVPNEGFGQAVDIFDPNIDANPSQSNTGWSLTPYGDGLGVGAQLGSPNFTASGWNFGTVSGISNPVPGISAFGLAWNLTSFISGAKFFGAQNAVAPRGWVILSNGSVAQLEWVPNDGVTTITGSTALSSHAGKLFSYAMSSRLISGSTKALRLYCNGKVDASTDAAGGQNNGVSREYWIGSSTSYFNGQSYRCTHLANYAWNRTLSDDDMQWLWEEPYAFFKPVRSPVIYSFLAGTSAVPVPSTAPRRVWGWM